jgi:hypothetical protein
MLSFLLPGCGLVTKVTGSQSRIPRHFEVMSKLACGYRTRCDPTPQF